MKLEIDNHHPRDDDVFFDEEPHIYYVKGKKISTSVTTFVHHFFPKFDADAIIDRMMNGRNWERSKYFGMTKEEIKQQWADAGTDATTKGTDIHKSIELFYNDCEPTTELPEFEMFKNFYEDHKDKLSAYRTEWVVYDEENDLAGSIDMVFKNNDGTLSIYDWKRTKEIKKKNVYGGKGTGALKDYDDCNYVHYSLQLNVYKYILEKLYGVVIRDMFLVCMHPNYDNYKKIQVLDLQQVVKQLLK